MNNNTIRCNNRMIPIQIQRCTATQCNKLIKLQIQRCTAIQCNKLIKLQIQRCTTIQCNNLIQILLQWCTAIPNRALNTVMSEQFCTLAMFDSVVFSNTIFYWTWRWFSNNLVSGCGRNLVTCWFLTMRVSRTLCGSCLSLWDIFKNLWVSLIWHSVEIILGT